VGIVSVFRPRAACVLAAAIGALAAMPARADVGDTTDALPGVVRVPLVAPPDRTGVALAASAGYGWTEAVLHEGDSHQRAFGSLAASVQALPFLVAGLRLDGRYDWSSGPQSTSGWIGDPRLEVRAGVPVGNAFRLGGQLGVWFPGNDAPSWIPAATTPDASVLASYHPPDSPITLASRFGFRLDNSAKSAPDADRLALSDRVSLGLNDANAVLAGLGISAAVSPRIEVLADATWDLLVGTGSPGVLKSPIVLSAGVRYALDPAGLWEFEIIGASSPSERPEVAVGLPLVDIEPRISGFVALMARPWGAHPSPVSVSLPVAPPPAPPAAPAIERAKLHGRILSEEGHAPIAAARLVVRSGSTPPREIRSDEQGYFEVDDLDAGPVSVDVTADGFVETTRTITLSASTSPLEVSLAKALPSGQVRGLVRDFGGKPLAAGVRIEPLGLDVPVAPDGTFQANVVPGSYNVVIHADGYADQKRRVVVERDGVTMLNVELRKGH
jgi:hypothetical protein